MTYQPEIPGLSYIDNTALEFLQVACEEESGDVARLSQEAFIAGMQDKVWGECQTGPIAEGRANWERIIGRLVTRPYETYTVQEEISGYHFNQLGGFKWSFGRLLKPQDAPSTISIDTTITAPIDKNVRYLIRSALFFQDPDTGRIKNKFSRANLRGTQYEVPKYSPFKRQQAKREYGAAFPAKFLAGVPSLSVDIQYTALGSTAATKTDSFTITEPSNSKRPGTLKHGNALIAYEKYCRGLETPPDYNEFIDWLRNRTNDQVSGNLTNIEVTLAEINRTESID